MLKKNLRLIISTFIVGILFGSLMSTVFAATATSNSKSIGPVNGYSYTNYAQISTDSGYIGARTSISKVGTGNVPTGYMGSLARAYKDGAVCTETSMLYNDEPLNGIGSSIVGHSGCGSGVYHSQGKTEVYNGNGYSTYYTNLTPNLNF